MTSRYRLDPALSRRAATRLDRGFHRAGWTPAVADDWTLDWIQGPPDFDAFTELRDGQAINHFPGFAAFGHKGYLHRNLTSARHRTGSDGSYDFHPPSFSLPEDIEEWRRAAAANPDRVWIVKPPRGGQGQGIFLLTDPALVPTDGEWVIQEYIDRPHLIDGRKYVLRTWVLVTSLDPLVCYLHENGVFKMTSRPFRSALESADDLPTHLTNPSVQALDQDVPLGSLNSDLNGYRRRLSELGIDAEPIFHRIRDAVIQSVIACRDQALIMGRGVATGLDGCFELLGPDILVDEDLKPWVLELNTFPSLEVGHDAEPRAAGIVRAAKDELVSDLASLLSLDGCDPPLKAGGFERVWPGADAVRFARHLSVLRPEDRRLATRACADVVAAPATVVTAKADVRTVDAGVALVHDGDVFLLNEIGAAVWLCLDDGLTPAEAMDELSAVFPDEPRERIETDVWDLLSIWSRAGLVTCVEQDARPRESLRASPTTNHMEGSNGARGIQEARPA